MISLINGKSSVDVMTSIFDSTSHFNYTVVLDERKK